MSPTVILLALGIDVLLGDPPNRFHPVAWAGSLIAAGRRRLAHGRALRLRILGAILVILVALLAMAVAALVSWAARSLGPVGPVIEAAALATLLSVRGLLVAARRVGAALERGDLDEARVLVGTHLVSRPTATLDAGHVASAAIESVAENLCDSLVAPLLFYLAFGLPGAALYRVLNTADAMIGYREGVLEDFGKGAARLDDVANLVPARLAALAMVAGAFCARASSRRAFAVMRRDHGHTASPNAGWTMAAMAGALGVSLEKPGAYRLGDGPLPSVADIARATVVVSWATAIVTVAALAATWLVKIGS